MLALCCMLASVRHSAPCRLRSGGLLLPHGCRVHGTSQDAASAGIATAVLVLWCCTFACICGTATPLCLLCLPIALILSQDEDDGGISDRPDDMADVYHTFFGIAGLSLMGYEGLQAIDPTYALPVSTVKRLKAQQE